jgi:hypothetical protein
MASEDFTKSHGALKQVMALAMDDDVVGELVVKHKLHEDVCACMSAKRKSLDHQLLGVATIGMMAYNSESAKALLSKKSLQLIISGLKSHVASLELTIECMKAISMLRYHTRSTSNCTAFTGCV